MSSISEIKKYDVIVCGGGIAGISAAIAAARQGMKTAIVEKQCLLGGLATSGLIYIYLPLDDGYGRQLTGGISEEMIRKCSQYGPFDLPEKWGGISGGNPGVSQARFQCCFSPAGFTLVLDKMLLEAKVDLWLDSTIYDVEMNEKQLRGIYVYNSSGRSKLYAESFVDATGGAFVLQMAGAEVFYEKNYCTPWFMEKSENARHFHFSGALHVQCAGLMNKEEFLQKNCHKGKETTNFVRKSWELIRARYDDGKFLQKKKNYPVHLPAMPQIRKIAAVKCRKMLDSCDHNTHFEDSIGLAGDWRQPGPVWETPFDALVPQNVEGVFVAGRCMGALNDAWEVYRVIPVAAMTGEVAGIAAAFCAKKHCSTHEIDYKTIQDALRKKSVLLYKTELKKSE